MALRLNAELFPLNNPLRAYFKSHSIAPFLCYWHRYVYHSVQDTLLHRHYQSTTTTERQVGQGRAREQTGNFSKQNSCTLKGNCTCLPRLYWTKIPLEFAIIIHDHKSRRKQKTLINFPPIQFPTFRLLGRFKGPVNSSSSSSNCKWRRNSKGIYFTFAIKECEITVIMILIITMS